jgi:hypothetical protein
MGSLHPLKGVGEAIERSKGVTLLRLKQLNRKLYDALKLEELSWAEQETLRFCVQLLPMPLTINDGEVIMALADPDRDFEEDFQATPFRYRKPMIAYLFAMFRMGTPEFEREKAVRRRLTLIRRVVLPSPGR